jgi:hypothetical protein
VSDKLEAAYVLPLRRWEPGPIEELASYLDALPVTEVIVVDGSSAPIFDGHRRDLPARVRHVRPDPDLTFAMGKVNGVITGVRRAVAERVVIADDDVRYDHEVLRRTAEMLDDADLVRPQNFFEPLTWHARWDTGRTLLNRVWSGDPVEPAADFPGTLAVRRSAFLRARAYDGDVMFENLELIRTVRAAGGTTASPLDLYVARRPPTTAHFFGQRVRQAYDDLALPMRIAPFLALGPAALVAARRRRLVRLAAAVAAGAIAVAEAGRRRAGGAARFPLSGSLLAPAWVAERMLCSWLAIGERFRGGIPYGGARIRAAATPERVLRSRYRAGPSDVPAARNPTSL